MCSSLGGVSGENLRGKIQRQQIPPDPVRMRRWVSMFADVCECVDVCFDEAFSDLVDCL